MIDSSHPEKGNSLGSANHSGGGRTAFVKRGEGTMGEGVMFWAGQHSAGGMLASLAGLSVQVSGRFICAMACGGGGRETQWLTSKRKLLSQLFSSDSTLK